MKKYIFLAIAALTIITIATLAKTIPTEKKITITNNQEQETSAQPGRKELHPDTIPAMSEKQFEGSDLKLERKTSENAEYSKYFITYKSEGFKISGVMNVPKGAGPFPVIILNHGYLDPEIYTNGAGLPRELDYFPRHGYVVLHSDYRNYAQSDFDPNNEVRPRSGYVEDVINAIVALKKSPLDFIDKENIGMFGHSMGGGIALNIMVTKPDIAKAYVLYAPINSDYKVNFDRWVAPLWPNVARQFYDTYGTPEENSQFWNDISAKNFFDNITQPIMLHQGTADAEVPVQWSRELNTLIKQKNKNIIYYEYPGQPHVFGSAESIMLERSLEFFDANLEQ